MTAALPTRVGLIGCGFHAQNHLNAWNNLKANGADLVALRENFRFETPMRRVKARLVAGDIGQPNWARIRFRTGYDIYAGQPYLMSEDRLSIIDSGVDVRDLARWFMGEVDHLTCETQRRHPKIKAEATATILLRHKSGAVSVVETNYEAHRIPDPFPETLLEIDGTEGSVIVTPGEQMTVTSRGKATPEFIGSPLLPWTARPWHVSQEAVLHTCAPMLACYRARKPARKPAETDGADSLKTFALVEAAYQSAKAHRRVRPKFSWPWAIRTHRSFPMRAT